MTTPLCIEAGGSAHLTGPDGDCPACIKVERRRKAETQRAEARLKRPEKTGPKDS